MKAPTIFIHCAGWSAVCGFYPRWVSGANASRVSPPCLQVWNPSFSEGIASYVGSYLISSGMLEFKFEVPAYIGIPIRSRSRWASMISSNSFVLSCMDSTDVPSCASFSLVSLIFS